jgi:hypothetical protein
MRALHDKALEATVLCPRSRVDASKSPSIVKVGCAVSSRAQVPVTHTQKATKRTIRVSLCVHDTSAPSMPYGSQSGTHMSWGVTVRTGRATR